MDKHVYFDLKYDDGAEWKRRKREDIFILCSINCQKYNTPYSSRWEEMRFIAGYVTVIQTLSFTLLTFYPGTIKWFSHVAVMANTWGIRLRADTFPK